MGRRIIRLVIWWGIRRWGRGRIGPGSCSRLGGFRWGLGLRMISFRAGWSLRPRRFSRLAGISVGMERWSRRGRGRWGRNWRLGGGRRLWLFGRGRGEMVCRGERWSRMGFIELRWVVAPSLAEYERDGCVDFLSSDCPRMGKYNFYEKAKGREGKGSDIPSTALGNLVYFSSDVFSNMPALSSQYNHGISLFIWKNDTRWCMQWKEGCFVDKLMPGINADAAGVSLLKPKLCRVICILLLWNKFSNYEGTIFMSMKSGGDCHPLQVTRSIVE